MTHKITLVLTREMSLSDLEDPESSFELTDAVEEMEDNGWIVDIKSVSEDGDEEE